VLGFALAEIQPVENPVMYRFGEVFIADGV